MNRSERYIMKPHLTNHKRHLIGDKLNWKDKLKKKKGYLIEKGSNKSMINLESNVRNIRTNV